MLLYFVTFQDNKPKAFDYVIRKVIKHGICTNFPEMPSIGIEVWDACAQPMTYQDFYVPCSIAAFMENISMTNNFLYSHPFYAHHLLIKQNVSV
jgi:hypothetical protein